MDYHVSVFPDLLKALSHMSHLYGFSPVWTIMCVHCPDWLNDWGTASGAADLSAETNLPDLSDLPAAVSDFQLYLPPALPSDSDLLLPAQPVNNCRWVWPHRRHSSHIATHLCSVAETDHGCLFCEWYRLSCAVRLIYNWVIPWRGFYWQSHCAIEDWLAFGHSCISSSQLSVCQSQQVHTTAPCGFGICHPHGVVYDKMASVTVSDLVGANHSIVCRQGSGSHHVINGWQIYHINITVWVRHIQTLAGCWTAQRLAGSQQFWAVPSRLAYWSQWHCQTMVWLSRQWVWWIRTPTWPAALGDESELCSGLWPGQQQDCIGWLQQQSVWCAGLRHPWAICCSCRCGNQISAYCRVSR